MDAITTLNLVIISMIQQKLSIKYVMLFLMIFYPSTPCHKLSQILDPLKVCHTSEQKVNQKKISGRLPLNNCNCYYILNNNTSLY